ncbi:MAG: hypothetical protein WDN69_22120 [Aliidongia sp.]
MREITSGAPEEQAFNTVLERSAAAGIAVQFSSGDSGDQGLNTPLGAVSVPSNSPYVTAVGGTSVMNDPLASSNLTGRDIVTGWGTAFSILDDGDFGVFDPPQDAGFPIWSGRRRKPVLFQAFVAARSSGQRPPGA